MMHKLFRHRSSQQERAKPESNYQDGGQYIQVYLSCAVKCPRFYHWRVARYPHQSLRLFRRITRCFQRYRQRPMVFFKHEQALQHGRYINHKAGVIKLYVDEADIIGRRGHLSLREGAVTPDRIHGYFVGASKKARYVENPQFDMDLLAEQ